LGIGRPASVDAGADARPVNYTIGSTENRSPGRRRFSISGLAPSSCTEISTYAGAAARAQGDAERPAERRRDRSCPRESEILDVSRILAPDVSGASVPYFQHLLKKSLLYLILIIYGDMIFTLL